MRLGSGLPAQFFNVATRVEGRLRADKKGRDQR